MEKDPLHQIKTTLSYTRKSQKCQVIKISPNFDRFLQKIARRTNAKCAFSSYIGCVPAIKTAGTHAINAIKTAFIARETTLKRRLPLGFALGFALGFTFFLRRKL
jgi:hypothetical protein